MREATVSRVRGDRGARAPLRSVVAAAAVVLALVAASCGDDDGAAATATPADTAPTTTAPTETAGADRAEPWVEETWALGQTVWFEGFTYELVEVTTRVYDNENDTEVELTAVIANLIDEMSGPPRQVGLEMDGALRWAEANWPRIDGLASDEVIVRWAVPHGSPLDTAVVVFGDESVTQAQVALDGSGGRTNEPVELALPDPLTYDGFEFDFDEVAVHFDRPWRHDGRFEGAVYVAFTGTVTNTTGEEARRPSFRLVTPDGDDHVANVFLGDTDIEAGGSSEFAWHYEVDAAASGTFQWLPTGLPPGTAEPVLDIEIPSSLD
ncbi:MAG: hypothetical protein ACXIVQ_08885 [Acidimicrobiales bacterium]